MNPELEAAGLTDEAIDAAVEAWFADIAEGTPRGQAPAEWLRNRMRRAIGAAQSLVST